MGDKVLVPTDSAPEVAECVWAPQRVDFLCRATFLKDFEPVSMRMVKDQDLPPNPLKISGACGRLMCCLKYEHPLYQEFKVRAPAVGETVSTDEGDGRVVAHSVSADSVVVRLDDGGRRCACSLASVCAPRQAHEATYDAAGDSAQGPSHGST